MKKKASDICVGIVGAGIMGSGHALYISESIKGARVAGIYDANAIVAKKVASKVKKTRQGASHMTKLSASSRNGYKKSIWINYNIKTIIIR